MQISAIFCRKWSSSSSGEFKQNSLLTKELRIVLVQYMGMFLLVKISFSVGQMSVPDRQRIPDTETPHRLPETRVSKPCTGYWNIYSVYRSLKHLYRVSDTGTSTPCTWYWNIYNMCRILDFYAGFRILKHPQNVPENGTLTYAVDWTLFT
jgi:hypothetical protein